MTLIRQSCERMTSWRCPTRQWQYLLFLTQARPNLTADPWAGPIPLGQGISHQKWKMDGKTSRNLPEVSANTAGIHPQWSWLGLGLSPLQFKGGDAESLIQIYQRHQHFPLSAFYCIFCLSYGQLTGFEMSPWEHPNPHKSSGVL